jgi:hypothetical protein
MSILAGRGWDRTLLDHIHDDGPCLCTRAYAHLVRYPRFPHSARATQYPWHFYTIEVVHSTNRLQLHFSPCTHVGPTTRSI